MTAQLVLVLDRAYRGIHLQLGVKFFVVRLTDVFHKVPRPGPAIAPFGLEPRIEVQRLTLVNGQQSPAHFQCIEFVVVLNAGQFQAIYFFILAKQRFMRRT